MKNFNIKRFKCLLRWTYEHDRAEFVKSTLWGIIGMILCVVLIQWGQSHTETPNKVGMMAMLLGFLTGVVITGSNMHYCMKTRDDWRMLSVLPASNLEKFLARYASSLLMMVGVFVALAVADVTQYLVILVLNSEKATLLGNYFLHSSAFHMITDGSFAGNVGIASFVLMLHSCYLVGGNFFRNTKYGWVFTTMTLVLLGVLLGSLLAWLKPEFSVPAQFLTALCLLVTVFNYWLAYRLFCRRQLIDKFVNL